MRRLLRHLFTLCSALSLLLCVAVCVLWVRSYVARDRLLFPSATGLGTVVSSERGSVIVRAYGDYDPVTGVATIATAVSPVSVSYSALTAFTTVVPAMWLYSYLRHRGRNRGFPVLDR